MTKKELATRIATETGLHPQKVLSILQKSLDYITDALVEGDHIEFRDFGVFEIQKRRPRIGRNPNRPTDVVQIPERRVVKFKPGKKMRERVLQG